MAGTKAGGQKAAATNKARHGADFTQKLAPKVARSVQPVVLPLTVN